MYYSGEGVPTDFVLAYAWYNLAAAGGQNDAVKSREFIEKRLSSIHIAEAQRLGSNWQKGQVLAREGRSPGVVSTEPPSGLAKKRTGTLFLVSKAGHAITNHHVIAGCKELRIAGRAGDAKLITEDSANDLALIQVSGTVQATAPLAADPFKLRQGEDIVVFGFPLNSLLSSGGNLTLGVVSALTGLGNDTNQIQITASIQPGSSGSPVLNKKGEVVAMVSMKLSDRKMAAATGQVGQNVNFAIRGQTLRAFLDAHNVDYTSGAGWLLREKSIPDLGDEARKWTLIVDCWS